MPKWWRVLEVIFTHAPKFIGAFKSAKAEEKAAKGEEHCPKPEA